MQVPVMSPPPKADGGDSFHDSHDYCDHEVVTTEPLDSRSLKSTHTKQRGARYPICLHGPSTMVRIATCDAISQASLIRIPCSVQELWVLLLPAVRKRRPVHHKALVEVKRSVQNEPLSRIGQGVDRYRDPDLKRCPPADDLPDLP